MAMSACPGEILFLRFLHLHRRGATVTACCYIINRVFEPKRSHLWENFQLCVTFFEQKYPEIETLLGFPDFKSEVFSLP